MLQVSLVFCSYQVVNSTGRRLHLEKARSPYCLSNEYPIKTSLNFDLPVITNQDNRMIWVEGYMSQLCLLLLYHSLLTYRLILIDGQVKYMYLEQEEQKLVKTFDRVAVRRHRNQAPLASAMAAITTVENKSFQGSGR